jgi:hypothetical protein
VPKKDWLSVLLPGMVHSKEISPAKYSFANSSKWLRQVACCFSIMGTSKTLFVTLPSLWA